MIVSVLSLTLLVMLAHGLQLHSRVRSSSLLRTANSNDLEISSYQSITNKEEMRKELMGMLKDVIGSV